MIVESPAKAKTIEGYLGPDFIVKSSFGHVRDLPKGDKAIDIKNGFRPTYEITEDKVQVVADLRKLAKKAAMIWLATDDDREGEAISWHLYEALDLNASNTKRIVFREITKKAILNAIESPRTIDIDLVNAQQARRVLDRLVGFELSPVLWKKIKRGLSAGRVQSVAVRLIVDREREIEKFNSTSSYKITAIFDLDGKKKLVAELPKKFDSEKEAYQFLEKCNGAKFSISNLESKPLHRSPSPPFTTSTLQQEASRKLGFSVAQTMTVAQRLYEAGKISYMRTDSFNLSEDAIASAKNAIVNDYGEEYFKLRRYKTKSETAQEAHEAIRPTDFSQEKGSDDRNEQRLYDLIRKRAKASQMADALIEKTTATIGISTTPESFIATGEVVKFEGFLKAYVDAVDDEDDAENEEENKGALPPISVGQVLQLNKINGKQVFSRPSARYNEAGLVKKLEEMGIGRPSTYAPTISTIQKRDYVIKENRDGKSRTVNNLLLEAGKITAKTETENFGAEKSKLFPTDIALIVSDFLVDRFPNVVDFSFTANIEKEFDDIAQGKTQWAKMIDNFYQDFHKQVVDTEENVDRANLQTGRDLGFHPVTGLRISTRLGRFGPFVQLGETPEEEGGEKPVYASLKKGQLMETITLEEALDLFKLPRTIGLYHEKPMVAAIGKFGPYIKFDSKFYSLPKEDDPMTVNDERAIEIIEAKIKAESEKLILEFAENEDIKVLNGRYGPYIVAGKKNVKIPKDKDPKTLTLAECVALADATPEPTKGRFGAKAKTVTKPVPKAKSAPKAAVKAKTATKTAVKKKPVAKKK